jgi:hypothetical protein
VGIGGGKHARGCGVASASARAGRIVDGLTVDARLSISKKLKQRPTDSLTASGELGAEPKMTASRANSNVAALAVVAMSLAFAAVVCGDNSSSAHRHLDVVFLFADDLRSELGCYGCRHMVTPAMDSLAMEGVIFDRMHASVAVCAPSRTAILTSRRPDTSRVWRVDDKEYWRSVGGNFTTLPQYFKEAGWVGGRAIVLARLLAVGGACSCREGVGVGTEGRRRR